MSRSAELRERARNPRDNRRGQSVVTSITPPPTFTQGKPKQVGLTRAERYWIQSRLERLGSARTASENALLDKVRL